MKTIIYNGIKFNKDSKTGYYLSSKNVNGKRIRLHRYVWENERGPIPKGMHIHHIDENKDNNDIDNLALLTPFQHEHFHSEEHVKSNPEWFERFQHEGIEQAKVWHASEKGREWHKKHYEQMKDALYKDSIRICQQCGKEYSTIDHGNNKFCSNKCKSQWRRDQHLDDVDRKCVICGKEFKANKYSTKKTCSHDCSIELQYRTRWGKSKKH
ncbi:HNH endonuclease signature motif containing protein [Lentilactobacillus sp. SPB1-3]|uniref:HNH endonuclease signature motif containing protein n=1 Tax=Lentilactobacillus terminaliae TaxID=3003483 RepID=A0ACD5DDL5_9LACO|nr:HNH endonuclease signature motif containing protein [Lentilactobacillus sp. SPB1-3]MCZ0978030.1 HNH endonuclease signature motif containing protein [Lentilactobacillus sp. SPB1-3]